MNGYCPDCGSDDIKCKFVDATSPNSDSYEDYYKCKCRDCGYKWSEEA